MIFKYYLPKINNMIEELETPNNSLIIIGANGSGKSKLGAWIEQRNSEKIHRIGAQRSLNFGNFINQKSYEQAEKALIAGSENFNISNKMDIRWSGVPTTKLLNDYEHVLSMVIALKNKEHDKFVEECKSKKENGEFHCDAPETVIDEFQEIWNNIFPHRQIKFDDAKVTAINNSDEYKGNQMSDGERVALYLIAQCLALPDNIKTIIIDEPELHIHRSIMNKLWTEIENARPNKLFIYITHDTQFAASHKQAEKIWVKSFDGKNWEIEKINDSELPEQLLLDILGNRKPVLFVEGTNSSNDTKLYREIYKKHYVIGCGSCKNVITQVRNMKSTPQLYHLEVYGIIDRDFRVEKELESLKRDGIYTIDVAEVENIFLVKELLKVINNHQGFEDDTNIEKIKNHIVNTLYRNNIKQQICEAIINQIKYVISKYDVTSKFPENIISEITNGIDYTAIKKEKEDIFKNTLSYKEILKIFNKKDMVKSIGSVFGLTRDEYCNLVLRLIKKEKRTEIIRAISNYLPSEITI